MPYLVSYDLHGLGRDYSKLKRKLREIEGTELLDSVWVLPDKHDSDSLVSILTPYLLPRIAHLMRTTDY